MAEILEGGNPRVVSAKLLLSAVATTSVAIGKTFSAVTTAMAAEVEG